VPNLLLLAIESSCDETSVSLLEADFAGGQWKSDLPERVRVLAHIVESQTSHLPFGGVVPEVAARDHLLKITPLTQLALQSAQIEPKNLDAIAVTLGPGLIGALMVGTIFAQGLAAASGKPLIGINHVDAHLAPALLLNAFQPANDLGQWKEVRKTQFPALALTVSGGHCLLSYLKSPHERLLLGHTADDACGEAFDKVAKLLGLPYPGGPHLEQLALQAEQSPSHFKFKSTLADKQNRYGFSFSGLKTQVLDTVRRELGHPTGKVKGDSLPMATKSAIASSFQMAAIGQLIDRLKNAVTDHPEVRSVLIAGGVAANNYFRQQLQQFSPLEVHFAPMSLCSDNATMIGLHALIPNSAHPTPHPFSRYPYELKAAAR
jgi:N6-L-threonylcarbamoyladenine synthase